MDQGQEDNSPINIEITDSKITKHVSYTIKGNDKIGSFEAERRYNDFHILRVTLQQRWPACYIPPIPSKANFGNNEPKLIEDRKRFLQYFLEQMATLRYLYFSDEFQTFLRTKNQDIEKALQGLPRQSVMEVCQKYKNCFPHLNNKEINTDMTFKISSFQTYLTKSVKQLETLKEQVKVVAASKKAYTDQFNNMTQALVPDYEKNILIEYVNQRPELLIFTNNNDVGVTARAIKDASNVNNYELILDMIRIECREVDAFIGAMESREFMEKLKKENYSKLKEYESEKAKLIAGKTTLKSIFTKGNNQEQVAVIDKKIQDTTQEIEYNNQVCDLIVLVLCVDEIDRFKKNKQRKYYQILQKISQAEAELNQNYLKFWNDVVKGTEVEIEN
ncbi:hypothetical protein pb186bvf_009883 [Paramecium bursaria]